MKRLKYQELGIDIQELAYVLWKKIGILLLCTIIGAGVTGVYTKLFVTPQYQSSAMIYIYGSTASFNSSKLTLSSELTEDYTTLAKSREVMEGVIDKMGFDCTTQELASAISVSHDENSSILMMTATNSDPKVAADIANSVADETAERISEVMNIDKPSTVEDAVVSSSPVSPNLLKNILIGAFAGLVIAAGVIILSFLKDDTIKTSDDVAHYLDTTLLACLPKEKTRK
ncbi:YveK family protein [Sellimonas catena]|uniref:Chain-length determining protein n=1 Tax=Sellimonas catena TaxID=2994035 RepID=A0A9W6CGW6_9FIRM|nr:Wzz/FepE/Etk N-terminal domain-containing protein [Sellimonas catena]GLG92085.1 chain-length determining protein [Sellimonas catena]